MTDLAAEAQELCRWLRAWCVRPNAPRGARRRVERFHRWADTVVALSVRLAQAERLAMHEEAARNSLDDARGYIEELKARLRECEEALGNEYECAHGHRWWMKSEPKRCPDCNTSSFSVASAGDIDG